MSERRSNVWAALWSPKGRRGGEPPSSVLEEPAVDATSVTGGGGCDDADRTHSTSPPVTTTKRCVPKHTAVPGSQETVVKAIRRVLGRNKRRRAKPLPGAPTIGVLSTD